MAGILGCGCAVGSAAARQWVEDVEFGKGHGYLARLGMAANVRACELCRI
jgi:hypothetical protein